MLSNISYNDPKLKLKIDTALGKPFTLQQRWKMGGIGSPKLTISSCSKEIYSLLILDQNSNQCNIELRPKGIIIRFRSLLETYGLIIPYYKLNLYKGKANEYSLYQDHQFVKVVADSPSIHTFFKKISAEKARMSPPSIEDL
ncbi:MAG: hypothetical protein O3B46_00560 [Bacteroidetes bacterium]|nr:hypothetical protein [Bacteroidota bacterium]MDA0922181.1 hypothetical protein [Bacteroidota bacterium]MDA1287916.1 hypothetical protein [Bacteroidota bacterium]